MNLILREYYLIIEMSIAIPISSLSTENRQRILHELHIEYIVNKRSRMTSAYWIDDYDIIHLPFHWAVMNGFTPRDKIEYPILSGIFSGSLRENQRVVKREAVGQLSERGCALLSLHVGWGKSVLAVYLACKLKLKTLIVVNRIVLANQWMSLIESMVNPASVQFVKTKQTLDPEMDIYIINAMNVPKFPPGSFKTIGTMICDEIHLLCAKSLAQLFFYVTPFYLIGLSATPHRPDGLDQLLDLYFGERKIIKPLFRNHTVYAIHTGFKPDVIYTEDGRLDWNSVLTSQSQDNDRNNTIVNIIVALENRSVLVLCKRIEQGRTLVSRLEALGESVTDLLGSKREFDTEARIVIATNQKCGVGFSHNRLDALLLASDAESYFIQYLGRVFRTPDVEPIVIDLIDNHSVLKKHFRTRKKVYTDAGGTIRTIRSVDRFISDLKLKQIQQ